MSFTKTSNSIFEFNNVYKMEMSNKLQLGLIYTIPLAVLETGLQH